MVDPGRPSCLQDLFCSSLPCDFAFTSSKIGKNEATKEKGKKK
jgi:hypothetical protein